MEDTAAMSDVAADIVPAVPAPVDAAVEPAFEHPTRNRLLAGILALLVLYACAVASVLIVPLLLAVLLSLMLAPAVRMLCGWHLPRALASLLVLVAAFGVTGVLLGSLVEPGRAWLAQVPKSVDRIELALTALRKPLQAATDAGVQLSELADIGGDQRLQRVVDAGPSHLAQLASATPAAVASSVATVLLVFMFLLNGEGLLRKFVELAPALHIKKDIVLATRSAQAELSTYMITIAVINAVLGLASAGAFALMGVESPLLWGGVVAILNFVPFVGPMIAVLLLVVVGFGAFATPLAALCVPGAFLALHVVEGQLVTPLVVGRRLALDPVMVFVALMLFGWLWGVAGLLMALPLLTCVRIVAHRVPAWSPLARMLGA